MKCLEEGYRGARRCGCVGDGAAGVPQASGVQGCDEQLVAMQGNMAAGVGFVRV